MMTQKKFVQYQGSDFHYQRPVGGWMTQETDGSWNIGMSNGSVLGVPVYSAESPDDLFDRKISEFCGGNQDAINLINSTWQACETWDDLVDKDKNVGDAEINRLIIWAMFELTSNPVYRAFPALAFTARMVVSNWMAANRLQKSPVREHKITAYTLRCCAYDFFVAVIACVSGPTVADEAAYFIRAFQTEDRLEHFLNEHSEV